MLSLIDKLINEHGSSNILRDRLELVKEEYQRLESKCSELQSENGALSTELEQERERANQLQEELDQLRSGAFAKYVCDHCGSANLTRKGNRLDPTFGDMGIKQMVFECNACGKESTFRRDNA